MRKNRYQIKRKLLNFVNVILLLCLFFFGCKNQENSKEKFDRIKWNTMKGTEYPYRNRMVKDLIANQSLKGLKKEDVISLLGEPTRTDSSYLFYMVDQTLFANFFPLHTKTLVIKIGKDSTVEWRKIHQ